MNFTEENLFDNYFQPAEDVFSMFLNKQNSENKETDFVYMNNEVIELSKTDNLNIFGNFYNNFFGRGNEQTEQKKEQTMLNKKRMSNNQNKRVAQGSTENSFEQRKYLFKTFKNDKIEEKNDYKKKRTNDDE